MSRSRAAIALVVIALAAAATRNFRGPDAANRPLSTLPYQLTGWAGRDAAPLDADTARELAADSYLMRRYAGQSSLPVDLYIAYYRQQRPGVSIHSPLHCLPGTGWEALEDRTIELADTTGIDGRIRRLLVQKTLARAVVLYWYAIHGRVLDGEIASKFWLLHDALRFGRSDAALIRVVVPVPQDGQSAVESAEREGVGFTRALLPYLQSLWS